MRMVKARGNKSTEMRFIALLRLYGIKGWRRKSTLEGKPDFVFPNRRTVVFIDGCFWHGHPTLCRLPRTNRKYWVQKIEGNKVRDDKVNKTLRRQGWKVLRIWENDLSQKRHVRCIARLQKALRVML